MTIQPHVTGHAVAPDGRLLRVDHAGDRWVATRYASGNSGVSAHDVFYGSDEEVHAVFEQWSMHG